MDKNIEKCFKKWARLVRSNDNLSEAFRKKSRNDLIVLRSIPAGDREWRATTAYYARYHMLTALLLKIGIDCKDHNCSIEIAEKLFSNISEKIFLDLRRAKKQRINLQYYMDRPVSDKDLDRNLKNVDVFVNEIEKIIEGLTREKIETIRRKIL